MTDEEAIKKYGDEYDRVFNPASARHPFDREISDAFVATVLTALAQGPVGDAILGLVRGERVIVVRQSPDHQGWIVTTEAAPGAGPRSPGAVESWTADRG